MYTIKVKQPYSIQILRKRRRMLRSMGISFSNFQSARIIKCQEHQIPMVLKLLYRKY